MLATDRAVGLTLHLQDRFGDYGLISIMLGVEMPDEAAPTLRVDTWLMSCRAIARTVEQYFLASFIEEAKSKGYARLVGEFVPTAKNALVADLYTRMGFDQAGEVDGVERYELDLGSWTAPESFVKAK